MKKIISKQNETIKRIKSLEKKKYREKYSEILLEGYRLIEDALESNLIIKTVLYTESIDRKKAILVEKLFEAGAEVIEADEEVFGYISDTVNSQGLLAIAEMPSSELKDIPVKPQGFIIYLDRMQDPGNLGTVIRTADAAGAECVAISAGSVDAYNTKVLRSAMGSVFHLPVMQNVSGKQFIGDLKRGGYRVIAADLKGAKLLGEIDYGKKACLVIGNEGAGIRDEILDICDESVKIPIIGHAESLNAAVAAGILLYDIAMKRNC